MTDDADVLANISKAFYSRFTELTAGVHNEFYNAVAGRLYEDEAPEESTYPYAVYNIIASPKDKTFSEEFRDTLLQLSIFSSASSSAEIKDAYAHASALYDDCFLTITGSTLIWFREINMVPMMEEYTIDQMTQSIRHYAVDYEIKTSLN